jgi:hypothetical protein
VPLKFWQGERKELWLSGEELAALILVIQNNSPSVMDQLSIQLSVSHSHSRPNLVHVKLTRRQTAILQYALVDKDIYRGLQELLNAD